MWALAQLSLVAHNSKWLSNSYFLGFVLCPVLLSYVVSVKDVSFVP
jgi:hypothetical protein